jgi:hypothetical protein
MVRRSDREQAHQVPKRMSGGSGISSKLSNIVWEGHIY